MGDFWWNIINYLFFQDTKIEYASQKNNICGCDFIIDQLWKSKSNKWQS